MVIHEIAGALQNSALASVFAELSGARVEEKKGDDGKSTFLLRLRLKSPMSEDDSDSFGLVIKENDKHVVFSIPGLAQSKDFQMVARCGDVNHLALVGRMCWDPSDGEISVDWVLRKTGNHTPPLAEIEYVIACLLQIYVNESVYAFAVGLSDKGKGMEVMIKRLLKEIQKRMQEEFLPPIHAVLQG